MKAALLYENGDLKFEDINMPVISDHEALIKIKASGIYGSDKNRLIGKERPHHYPTTLGHEFSGEVVEIGKNVSSLKIGDRITGVPILACHKCGECQLGNFAQCENYDFIGYHVQGAF